MKLINFKVPQMFADKVDDYVSKIYMNKSEFIRAAINEYMQNHPVEGENDAK